MNNSTFQALFEHSSVGIIISNLDGVIERANPFATRMFGYDADELNGKMIEVLIPAHIREKHVTYRQNYNKNPHPRGMGSNLNLKAVKKNGDQFPVEVSLTFFDADGRKQIVSFINDTTVRKKAEDNLVKLTEELETKVTDRTKELSDALLELSHTNEGLQQEMEQRKKIEAQIRGMLEKEKELNELKSRFVSMASHEFRTPLGGILTSISLIAKYTKTEDEPKRQKHIQIIKKSVKNLTNILNDFLSLDKLEQGKVSSRPTEFEFVEFIQSFADDVKETSNHTLELVIKKKEILINQDKEMIRNVLTNLLSNAIKYSPEESTITVRVDSTIANLEVEIEDQGMGIPEKDQKHLFERFFRAQNVTNLQGTGLGLNIVKRYLDLLGGTIDYESIVNKGTTFKISLPLEKL